VQQAIGSNQLAVAAMAMTSRNNDRERYFSKMEQKSIGSESSGSFSTASNGSNSKERKHQLVRDKQHAAVKYTFW